ncbi:MAG: hypothetical protein LAO19_00140 [Acidobacteriia bacterium]|nr:hypothetical protein [Terriglobia bacterium]
MPPTCTVCRHAERDKIDADLLIGTPYRHIAARTGTSTGALQRHRCHIAQEVIHAAETCEADRGASLLEKIHAMEAEAQRLGKKAESAGDLRAALLALRELGRAFELQGRMMGAFQRDSAHGQIITVNVLVIADDDNKRPPLPADGGSTALATERQLISQA